MQNPGIASAVEKKERKIIIFDRFEKCAKNNKIKINRDKCKALHLRKRNQMHKYKMRNPGLATALVRKIPEL